MKPSTIQLLKDKPEECKEIATDYSYFNQNYVGYPVGMSMWDAFVKEALRPDWEILSFKSANGNIYTLQPDGEYKFLSSFDKDNMLNCVDRGAGVIHSVRRSDGEVFEVDEIISLGSDKKYTLTGFEVENGHMFIKIRRENDFGDISSGRTYLNEAVKLKPLFKIEDGKDVYEGDRVYVITKGMRIDSGTIGSYKNPLLIYFSTRSAAEQWVEDHCPSVSIAQIREFAEKDLPFQPVEALLNHLTANQKNK